MRVKQISADLAITGQVMTQDLQALADQGFQSIICNRPDFEGVGQPTFNELKSAAKKLGMEARHIPVGFGGVSQNTIDEFGEAIKELPGPIVAFCLSGARSSMLASRSQPRPVGAGANNFAGAMGRLTSMFTGRA